MRIGQWCPAGRLRVRRATGNGDLARCGTGPGTERVLRGPSRSRGGLYTVELVDANGCLTSAEVLVPATEAADVDFITGPVEVCFEAEVDFQDPTGTLLWRRWDFGDGTGWFEVVDGEETGTAQHTYLAPGIYPAELTVENADGCYSTGSQDVVVVQGLQVFVPSAFTPNNDGKNDARGHRHGGGSLSHGGFRQMGRGGV